MQRLYPVETRDANGKMKKYCSSQPSLLNEQAQRALAKLYIMKHMLDIESVELRFVSILYHFDRFDMIIQYFYTSEALILQHYN